MNDKPVFRDRYRIPPARLASWDYGDPGWYFVTICTKNRAPWFGSVRNGGMDLSDAGRMADACWRDIPRHFPHVTVDAHVVMPDHVHGIVVIHERMAVETPNLGVSTTEPITGKRPRNWGPGYLGSIINQYKRACTCAIKSAGHPDFAWQPRYHDHILWHASDIEAIRRYIVNNPLNWELMHAGRR